MAEINHYLIPIALGFFPAIAWLIFFSLEDRMHPEPKKMLFKVFIVGVISALGAAVLQLIVQDTAFAYFGIKEIDKVSFIIFASIEEIVKFIAVYLTVKGSKYLDEPVDFMMYMITGALGFAAIENSLFLLNKGPQIVLEIMVLRAVGATLLHALSSGFFGFYWARRKIFIGLLMAAVLHSGFNYLILTFNEAPVYATAILIFASFFLFYDFDIIKEDEREE